MKFDKYILLVVSAFCISCNETTPKPTEPIDNDGLKLVWKSTVGTDITTIPLIVGDSLVVGGGEASIVAVRLKDGAIKWNNSEGISVFFSPDRLCNSLNKVFGYQYTNGNSEAILWSLDTGKPLWRLKAPTEWELFGLVPACDVNSLYISGKEVYKIGLDNANIDFRVKTGMRVYSIKIEDQNLITFQAKSGSEIANNKEGIIQVLNKDTGDSKWVFKTFKGAFYNDGLVENGILYTGTSENPEATFYALDLNDGKVIWEAKEGWMPTEAFTDMSEQYIFLNDGGAVRALDKQTGKQRWKTNLDSGYGGSNLVYHEGYVYHPSGRILFVLNAQTGAIVHREYIEGGYVWNVAKSSKLLIARTSRAYNAYQYYQPN